KRSIRDLYGKDIEEIVVSGEQGYQEAREFMRMLMPSHAKHVKHYKDTQPLFTRYGIESQLDAMFSPVVQLRSGGYIVINQAEALVAIDVNSGRATREHHIEDTALKTNCEAAEEIARQLRLRDLAGLIVIDFIDMDEGRNNRTVERRLKEALRHDRARIQVGRISHFGLLEMSRQRIRTSVLESSTEKCPVCGGSGHVRSVSSVALQLLRAIEEMLIKGATHNLIVRTRAEVALYVLNHKRAHLRALEERFRVTLTVSADPTVTGQQSYVVDRGEQVHTVEAAKSIAAAHPIPLPTVDEEDEFVADEAEEDIVEAQGHEQEAVVPVQADEEAPRRDSEREGGPRRRRRRGRGGRGRGSEPREGAPAFTHDTVPEHAVSHEDHDAGAPEEEGFNPPQPRPEGGQSGETDRDGVRRRRRRGRRGGRRNRPHNGEAPFRSAENGAEPELQHAVEDLDRPPSYDSTPAASYAPPIEQRPAPAAMEPPAAPANAQEPSRRRSTIREPAPFASERAPVPSSPAAPSTPVISSTGPEEPATPKRGWWGKRLLGDKS
ncbi:MAG TPA: ribonuclease E/G, partial [Pseudolabrys sp.]|nr:ribonuclease E/G [Pseudolabrys sp.]